MKPCGSPRACVRRRHREEPPPRRRWYRRRLSFTMACGLNGAVDRTLIDAPALSYPSCLGGFLAPLLLLLPSKQLVEQKAIFFGEFPDPIQDLVNGCATHEPALQEGILPRERPNSCTPIEGLGDLPVGCMATST